MAAHSAKKNLIAEFSSNFKGANRISFVLLYWANFIYFRENYLKMAYSQTTSRLAMRALVVKNIT